MEFHQYFCCSLPYFYTKEVYVSSCSILNFYEFKSDSVKRQIGFWYETIACESVVPIIMKHETWSCAKSANWIRTFFANSSICATALCTMQQNMKLNPAPKWQKFDKFAVWRSDWGLLRAIKSPRTKYLVILGIE